jgi:hypothetical protein
MRPHFPTALLALLTAALILPACHDAKRHADRDAPEAAAPTKAPTSPSVADLARLMAGSFASTQQAKDDPAYYDIRLHMVPIWTSRTDGPWLYVEQAMAEAQDKPYRQRVYNLSRLGADKYQSAVYELPGTPEDALKFAGAWQDPARFNALAPADLRLKDGCEVVLKWDPAAKAFKGGTLAANCPSTLRGAAHATSEITLADGLLVSWDRGFDASGKQVWGAVKGGYRFVKDAAAPAPAPAPAAP